MKHKKKVIKKESFDLKNEYKKCFDFLKESKIFIYSIIILFFLFVLIGFFVPASESIIEQIRLMIQELLKQTEGMSPAELMGFIIFNNLRTSFFGMILGFFIGFVPMIFTMFNGYILGFVSRLSVDSEGFIVLWRLLPHGIFELPAVFISLGLGMKIGSFLFQKQGKKLKYLKEYFFNSFRIFFFIIIPLLIIAGIIEGTLIFLG